MVLDDDIVQELDDEGIETEVVEADEYAFNLEDETETGNKEFRAVYEKTCIIYHDNRYLATLPLKEDHSPLAVNKEIVHRRTRPETPSLNNCLIDTPPDLNELTGILLRFGLNQCAVSTDIKKAFLNVGLEEKDRDVTRLFGFSDPTYSTSLLSVYRFKSVLFGATCSPFISNAIVQKHLSDNTCEWT
ncbi:Hypothetical predicted protein [Mytilus galloprovincialis]|uniref:Reverse transcriptase domain-containing protein n=1 Tax=Mytilus galloprovincialis TaxID=29158 RepID=A0A8B6EKW8_MYTGA|nr:Hypothetical predicted protein [Mytilus galloprovincialis]